MPAAGPLRPAQLVGHDPADYIPSAPITRIPHASPARTMAACALHVPAFGTAWAQTDGTIAVAGNTAVAAELHTLIRAYQATDQPALTQFTCVFEQTGPPDEPLGTPHRWKLAADTAVRA